MYIFIDTSEENTLVSLLDQNLNSIDDAEKKGQRNQSEDLLKLIDEILSKSKKKKF